MYKNTCYRYSVVKNYYYYYYHHHQQHRRIHLNNLHLLSPRRLRYKPVPISRKLKLCFPSICGSSNISVLWNYTSKLLFNSPPYIPSARPLDCSQYNPQTYYIKPRAQVRTPPSQIVICLLVHFFFFVNNS